MSRKAAAYIHGYSEEEQERLCAQARFLEPLVFDGVDFSGSRRVLEIGCGVGAQTEILRRRFPDVFVQAVDLSKPQVARARERLREDVESGRVAVEQADAERLPYADGSFDGAFLCWVLEHTPRPGGVLAEVRRVLAPGGVLHAIEVMNASLYLHPACPATMVYWDEMNRGQEAAGGDPDVGPKLGTLLNEAGFSDTRTRACPQHYDQRDPAALARQLDYWETLLLSAAPQLSEAGRVDDALIQEMRREFRALKKDPRAVFYYAPIQAVAR